MKVKDGCMWCNLQWVIKENSSFYLNKTIEQKTARDLKSTLQSFHVSEKSSVITIDKNNINNLGIEW